MTWIGLRDVNTHRFSLAGIAARGLHPPRFVDDALLKRGSLQMEFAYTPSTRRQVLIDHRCEVPWPVHLRVTITPDAVLHFDLRCGAERSYMCLETGLTDCERAVELVYSWHAPDRTALLSLHLPYAARSVHRAMYDPSPVPLTALQSLIEDQGSARALIYLALSTDIEPIGPAPSLAGNAIVETPSGPRYVAHIQAGDHVLCDDGRPRPVIWAGHRDVPARGRFQPIRLRAPYFGLRHDTVVAPTQHIAFDGPDVEYLFGEERVLVSASHAVTGGVQAIRDTRKYVVRYHQLLLEDHALIRIGGAVGESLFLGALAKDDMALNASIWSGTDLDNLPSHSNFAAPVLKQYEAVTLTRAFV
ncbi:Hint domain-containing protein [Cognatishimia sp. MH4019]|uniref:Hint domain-containing protein n=1 Tax=Cognatishimia sp. MH4019 TaxID=2854030 RepID=UPI001CD2FC53|nr:Hint domain-containing protein [Cognatishimia sp. MH4019]